MRGVEDEGGWRPFVGVACCSFADAPAVKKTNSNTFLIKFSDVHNFLMIICKNFNFGG